MFTPKNQKTRPRDLSQIIGHEISFQMSHTASPTNATIKSSDQNTDFLLGAILKMKHSIYVYIYVQPPIYTSPMPSR